MLDERPLAGIRVLDLSRVLAGPFCAMNLADLGAEVIKIELPGRGDDSRGYAPRIPNSNDSGYYYSVNRGKLSATLDLRKPAGVAVALDLVRHCDVVLENFAPGTMERYGLGYAELAAANPRIILCSISGFGQSGPMASAPAYDIVAQALGGTMSITGPAGGDPTRCGVSIGDLVAALYGVIAILSALRVARAHWRWPPSGYRDARLPGRDARGRAGALFGDRHSAGSARLPPSLDHTLPAVPRHRRIFRRGRRQRIAVGALLRRDRHAGAEKRRSLQAQSRTHCESRRTRTDSDRHFAAQPRAHWLELLGEAGVPCAPIADVAEVSRNPHLEARQMILHAEHPRFAGLIVPGSPFKTAGHAAASSEAPNTRAPALGEHTERLLREVAGYDAEKIAALRAAGII